MKAYICKLSATNILEVIYNTNIENNRAFLCLRLLFYIFQLHNKQFPTAARSVIYFEKGKMLRKSALLTGLFG